MILACLCPLRGANFFLPNFGVSLEIIRPRVYVNSAQEGTPQLNNPPDRAALASCVITLGPPLSKEGVK